MQGVKAPAKMSVREQFYRPAKQSRRKIVRHEQAILHQMRAANCTQWSKNVKASSSPELHISLGAGLSEAQGSGLCYAFVDFVMVRSNKKVGFGVLG
jgi:hypothetical protein